MEIGIFQLENLILTQARFQFLILGENLPTELSRWAERGQKMSKDEALPYLQGLKQDPSHPVILLGADVNSVKSTAAEIEAAGFTNVYWVGV